jgi:hypothetical protein
MNTSLLGWVAMLEVLSVLMAHASSETVALGKIVQRLNA